MWTFFSTGTGSMWASSIWPGSGTAKAAREILAASNGKGGMDYMILEFARMTAGFIPSSCRLQNQATGLNVTADRVSGRRRLLHHYGIGEADDEG